jgi:hypothetical protein
MSGVKESKELLESLLKCVDLVDKILDDGKVDWRDVRAMIDLAIKMKPGLQGSQHIKDELSSASPEEVQEVADLGVQLAMKLIEKLS